MSKRDSVIARAERLIGTHMAVRQRLFAENANRIAARVARKGALWGSAHRATIRDECSHELHERASIFVKALESSHKAMSAPASDALRSESKDWISKAINMARHELEQHLYKPRAALGESGDPDNLQTESRNEVESAYASIDNAFDQIHRDRAERLVRFLVRCAQALRGIFARA